MAGKENRTGLTTLFGNSVQQRHCPVSSLHEVRTYLQSFLKDKNACFGEKHGIYYIFVLLCPAKHIFKSN